MKEPIDPRLDRILEVVCSIARQDFSRRIEVNGSDTIDAIAAGINMLAEELDGEVASRRELEEAHAALKDAQMKLIYAGKLASIGQLASGVAHEVNNPAAWVSLSLTMMQRMMKRARNELAADSSAAALGELAAMEPLFADCIEGMRRITAVIGDLRTIARADDRTVELISFEEVINASVSLARPMLKTVQVTVAIGDTPGVVANRGRIAQILTNLLVNAAQAIASAPPSDSHEIAILVTSHDAGTLLAVEDTGCGIPADHAEKVFEPFFTTKAHCDGTGIGLAIVAQIAASYGGLARVGDSATRAARVEVWFPSCETATS